MPNRQDVDAFVAMVEEGRFLESFDRSYAEDATAQENNEPPRIGRRAPIAHERRVLAAHRTARGRPASPPLVEGERVAINRVFEFERHDGATVTLDEAALQEWRDGRIVRERFFHDPAQLRLGAGH